MALAVHLRRFTQDKPAVERFIVAFTDTKLAATPRVFIGAAECEGPATFPAQSDFPPR